MKDGDHGLKIHAGKESQSKTLAAMQQVTSAIRTFAHSISSTVGSSVAKGKSTDCSSTIQQLQDKTVSDKPKAAGKRKATAKTSTAGKKVKG